MLRKSIVVFLLILGPNLFFNLYARELDWSLCGPIEKIPGRDKVQTLDEQSPVELTADNIRFDDVSGNGVLSGNVEIFNEDQYLRADQVQYFQQEELIKARDGIIFSDSNLSIKGPRAELRLKDNTAEFLRGDYRYVPRHARGEAERIYRKSDHELDLDKATYTTCNPGKKGWLISADKVELDRESGDGTARNVVVRFQDIPVLYTPWLRFPIDDRRKSGFLPPRFGTTSNSGTEIITPYYWNMAPNRDAVISPRWLSERGVQLIGEFRYLYPTNSGNLDLEYINDDKAKENRYFVSFKNSSHVFPRLSTWIDYNRASDGDYFEDFGNSLSETSVTHLVQKADVVYQGTFWNFLTRVQSFQTIDQEILPSNRPYERLPQLLFKGRLPDQNFGMGAKMNAEWVRFDRETGVTGDRLDALMGVDWPYVKAGFFAKPSVSVRFSAYKLRNTAPGVDDLPSLGWPIVSFDTGLIFERQRGDNRSVQTLEPRLFYLYVPFRDQSDIPVFDTANLDFNFSRLFRENRFAGGDRIGDANQLTLALTSRLIDTFDGREALRASVGQIYYFQKRRVTLPEEPPEFTNSSDFVGELQYFFGHRWSLRGTTVYNPHDDEFKRTNTALNFVGKDNRVLNLGYNFRRDDLKQTDIAIAWPLGPHWNVLGRWNYDVDNARHLEILGGLEYESCCWRAIVAMRRFINNADGEFANTLMFQLELKGLAKLGSSLDNVLERGILGYDAN